MIFLSYAEEDAAAARKVRQDFRDRGVPVYDWQESLGPRFIAEIEENLLGAEAFVVLLSPSYLASAWCRRERELALIRETNSTDHQFIRVVSVGEVPSHLNGFLDQYARIAKDDVPRLADSIARAISSAQVNSDPTLAVKRQLASFKNRDDELAMVRGGLRNPAGRHLWLVVAPPQLGKTWFMDHVAASLAEGDRPWAVKLVDLREYSRERRRDAGLLLAHLLGETNPVDGDRLELSAAAHRVVLRRKPHLCLLDSAELLDPDVTASLLSRLITVHHDVQDGGSRFDVRLALVVGSRRAEGWQGVGSLGRLEKLPLTEFPPYIIEEALSGLREQLGGSEFDTHALRAQADWVRGQTEGLPALLIRYMEWIRDTGFIPRHHLNGRDLFPELAIPYIRNQLLSGRSLFPGSREPEAPELQVLVEAFRALSPYRLFTQWHLKHQLQVDARLQSALDDARWSETDLAEAIENTALLLPSNQIWHELHPAIRRLLFRYHYPAPNQQEQAHAEARAFVRSWADGLTGTDRLLGIEECLWHEAAELQITHPTEVSERLSASAASFRESLLHKPFSARELRTTLAGRIRDDTELGELLGDAVNELIATVRGEK